MNQSILTVLLGARVVVRQQDKTEPGRVTPQPPIGGRIVQVEPNTSGYALFTVLRDDGTLSVPLPREYIIEVELAAGV